MDIRKLAGEAVEAIRRASAALSPDIRDSIFAEIAKQLKPTVKRRAKPTIERPTLNAIGKPYGANYDPNYKMRHRGTPISRLSRPGEGYPYANHRNRLT